MNKSCKKTKKNNFQLGNKKGLRSTKKIGKRNQSRLGTKKLKPTQSGGLRFRGNSVRRAPSQRRRTDSGRGTVSGRRSAPASLRTATAAAEELRALVKRPADPIINPIYGKGKQEKAQAAVRRAEEEKASTARRAGAAKAENVAAEARARAAAQKEESAVKKVLAEVEKRRDAQFKLIEERIIAQKSKRRVNPIFVKAAEARLEAAEAAEEVARAEKSREEAEAAVAAEERARAAAVASGARITEDAEIRAAHIKTAAQVAILQANTAKEKAASLQSKAASLEAEAKATAASATPKEKKRREDLRKKVAEEVARIEKEETKKEAEGIADKNISFKNQIAELEFLKSEYISKYNATKKNLPFFNEIRSKLMRKQFGPPPDVKKAEAEAARAEAAKAAQAAKLEVEEKRKKIIEDYKNKLSKGELLNKNLPSLLKNYPELKDIINFEELKKKLMNNNPEDKTLKKNIDEAKEAINNLKKREGAIENAKAAVEAAKAKKVKLDDIYELTQEFNSAKTEQERKQILNELLKNESLQPLINGIRVEQIIIRFPKGHFIPYDEQQMLEQLTTNSIYIPSDGYANIKKDIVKMLNHDYSKELLSEIDTQLLSRLQEKRKKNPTGRVTANNVRDPFNIERLQEAEKRQKAAQAARAAQVARTAEAVRAAAEPAEPARKEAAEAPKQAAKAAQAAQAAKARAKAEAEAEAKAGPAAEAPKQAAAQAQAAKQKAPPRPTPGSKIISLARIKAREEAEAKAEAKAEAEKAKAAKAASIARARELENLISILPKSNYNRLINKLSEYSLSNLKRLKNNIPVKKQIVELETEMNIIKKDLEEKGVEVRQIDRIPITTLRLLSKLKLTNEKLKIEYSKALERRDRNNLNKLKAVEAAEILAAREEELKKNIKPTNNERKAASTARAKVLEEKLSKINTSKLKNQDGSSTFKRLLSEYSLNNISKLSDIQRQKHEDIIKEIIAATESFKKEGINGVERIPLESLIFLNKLKLRLSEKAYETELKKMIKGRNILNQEQGSREIETQQILNRERKRARKEIADSTERKRNQLRNTILSSLTNKQRKQYESQLQKNDFFDIFKQIYSANTNVEKFFTLAKNVKDGNKTIEEVKEELAAQAATKKAAAEKAAAQAAAKKTAKEGRGRKAQAQAQPKKSALKSSSSNKTRKAIEGVRWSNETNGKSLGTARIFKTTNTANTIRRLRDINI